MQIILGLLGSFAALSALFGVVSLLRPYPAFQLHQWARDLPALVMLLTGIAGALFTLRHRLGRLAGVLVLLPVVVVLVAGTAWYRDRFSGDPLAAPGPELTVETVEMEKVRETRLDQRPLQLKVSPSGARLAFSDGSYDATDYDATHFGAYGASDFDRGPSEFQVELVDGGFVSIEALTLEFLDDDRVVTLTAVEDSEIRDGAALRLRLLTLAAEPVAESDFELPPLAAPKLRLGRGEGRWEVAGVAAEDHTLRLLAGDFGDGLSRPAWEEVSRHPLGPQQQSLALAGAFSTAFVSSRGRFLSVTQDLGTDEVGSWFLLSALIGFGAVTELSTLDGGDKRLLGRTSLQPTCVEPVYSQIEFVCTTSDLKRTSFWSVDADAGRITPLGTLDGYYFGSQAGAGGRFLLSGFDLPALVVEPARGRALNLERQLFDEQESGGGSRGFFASGVPVFALGPEVVAAAIGRGGETRVVVYRLPD